MNDLIREFAEHAELPNPHTPGVWTFNNSQLEFFAELIIQECCDVLKNENILHHGYGYSQGFLHKRIKEHFGVEE